jgi:hypothetical protein
MLNIENEILNYFKDVLIDYFIVVAVNFFGIAFRFFCENQHEKKQKLLKNKSKRRERVFTCGFTKRSEVKTTLKGS